MDSSIRMHLNWFGHASAKTIRDHARIVHEYDPVQPKTRNAWLDWHMYAHNGTTKPRHTIEEKSGG